MGQEYDRCNERIADTFKHKYHAYEPYPTVYLIICADGCSKNRIDVALAYARMVSTKAVSTHRGWTLFGILGRI